MTTCNTTIGTNITEDNNATDTTNTTSANIDYLGPVQAFGNVQPTWYNYAFAMTMFFFGFVPMFILYEMRNDMKNPSTSQVKSVLWVSTTFLILLYAIPGLICVILWGFNIKNPIIAELPRSNWIAYVITSYVFIPLIMDYCIITKVLRDHIIAAAAGATTAATTATTAAATRCKLSSTIYFNRFLCSLPQLIFALVVALTVPNFSSVVGISSGIITVGCQNWLIVLLLEYGYVRGGVYPSQQPNRILMNIGAFVTFLFTIWIVSSSIYEVITANYSDNFFCSG
jgi:amino acid permease